MIRELRGIEDFLLSFLYVFLKVIWEENEKDSLVLTSV